METLPHKQFEEDNILHRLKYSLDHVWSVRKRSADPPNRIEIQMSSSYILKDRSLDYKPFLTVIPEVHEELVTQPDQAKACSKFSTKIEFFKPIQRDSEESPSGAKSDSSELTRSPSKQISESSPDLITAKPHFQFSNLHRSNPASSPNPLQNAKPARPSPLILKAKEEISLLHHNKQNLLLKIQQLSNSLSQLESLHQSHPAAPCNYDVTMNLLSHLEKLERQQLAPESDARLPEAAVKVQNLESEIKNLKSLKDSSVVGYEQELKVINHKLKDLQECNEILTEILACFRKEPLLVEDQGRKSWELSPGGESFNDLRKIEGSEGCEGFEGFEGFKEFDDKMIATVKLEDLLDQQGRLEDVYRRRKEIIRAKEKLEAEYKEIPCDSKCLANKKRKVSLEYELSINYSQLVAANNKIKKYSREEY